MTEVSSEPEEMLNQSDDLEEASAPPAKDSGNITRGLTGGASENAVTVIAQEELLQSASTERSSCKSSSIFSTYWLMLRCIQKYCYIKV
jgi:hypothetical protein